MKDLFIDDKILDAANKYADKIATNTKYNDALVHLRFAFERGAEFALKESKATEMYEAIKEYVEFCHGLNLTSPESFKAILKELEQ